MTSKYNDANFFIASTEVTDITGYQMEVGLHGSTIDRAVLFNKCRKKALEVGLIKEGFNAFTTRQYNPCYPIDDHGDLARAHFFPIINSYFEEKYGKIGRKLNLRHSVKRGLLSEEQAKNLLYHESFIGIIPLKFLMVVPEGSEIMALASDYDPDHVGSKSFVFNAKKFFGKTNKKLYTLYGDWERSGVVFLDHKGLSTNQMFVVKDKVANQATVITKYSCRTILAKKVPAMIKKISKEIIPEPVITSSVKVGSDGRNANYLDVVQVALAHGWTFPKISELHPNAYKLYHEYSGGYHGGTKLIVAGNRTTRAHKFFGSVNTIQDIKEMGGYKFALGCYIAAYMQMKPVWDDCPEDLRWVKKITTLEFFKGNEDVGILVVGDKNNFTHNGIMYRADYRVEPITSFETAKQALSQKSGFEKAGFKNLRIFRRWTKLRANGPSDWRYNLLQVEKFENPTTVRWLPESGQNAWWNYYTTSEGKTVYNEGIPFPDNGWMKNPQGSHGSNQTEWGYLNGKVAKWDSSHFYTYHYEMVLIRDSEIVAGAKGIRSI